MVLYGIMSAKNTKKTTKDVANDLHEDANEVIENVKENAQETVEKVKHIADDVAHDAKEFAYETEKKAKELFAEGKKSVEDLVDKVIDDEKVNSYYVMLRERCKSASFKDWVIFALGVLALIVAIIKLGEFVFGGILLFLSFVLFNMFFNRK